MSAKLDILSTIKVVPVSYFVYSSLSYFAPRHCGELPGMWFVRALREAGRDLPVVRQTLYRMEAEGELLTRKEGRTKYYRASPYAAAEIDVGLSKILDAPAQHWDGMWTVVHVHLRAAAQRVTRERVVALLSVQGFALVGNDVYVHPREVGTRLSEALSAAARPHVLIVRGRLMNEAVASHLVSLWHIARLAQRYSRTVDRLRDVRSALRRGVTDQLAFLLRFAVVFEYLGVAWDDPELPKELLPNEWPGEECRELAASLYTQLLPAATRYAERLLQNVTAVPLSTSHS